MTSDFLPTVTGCGCGSGSGRWQILLLVTTMMMISSSSCFSTGNSGLIIPSSLSSSSSAVRSSRTSRTTMVILSSKKGNNNDLDDGNDKVNVSLFDRRKALVGVGGLVSSSLIYNSYSFNNNNVAMASASAAEPTSTTTSTTSSSTSTIKKAFPTWTIGPKNNEVQFPTMALNTVGLSTDDTVRACAIAIQYGFTHFDFHPGKERDGISQFMKLGKIERSKLFLNTKIRKPKPGTSPEDAAIEAQKQIDDDLQALNTDYVDMLMLRDSPDCEVMQAQWTVLENALLQGKTKSIGVVNYCEKSLRCLLKTCKIKPAVNYYYLHVGMTSSGTSLLSGDDTLRGYKLREYCDRYKIKTFAYGAFGEPEANKSDELLNNPLLKSIGDGTKNIYNYKNHGQSSRTPEEVALRWVIQSGAAVSVRPTLDYGLGKSVCSASSNECESSIKLRSDVFDWSLTGEEMNKLTNIIKSDDNPTLFSSAGCPDSFSK
jgi:diketogulonate reductase-like aldo/keto reductase